MIEVAIEDGGTSPRLTEPERAEIEVAVRSAADGFDVRLSYVRGPIARDE